MDINSLFTDINEKFNIRDKNRLTYFFIMTAAVVFADLSWSWLHKVLHGESSWIWVAVGMVLFMTLLSLSWLMLRTSKVILIVSFLVILISFITLFGYRLEYVVVLSVALLLFIFGSLRSIKEKDQRINIRCFKIFRLGLPYLTTGLVLIIATAIYFSPLVLDKTTVEIPRPLFNTLIRPLMNQVEEEMPVIEGEEAVDYSVSFLAIDPEILKRNNIVLDKNPTPQQIEDAIYVLTNRQVNNALKPFQQFIPLGLAIGYFILLKTLAFFLMYIAIFLAWLIFRILVNVGAIRINVEPTVKETIEM